MCTVCGCGNGQTRIEGHNHDHDHHPDHVLSAHHHTPAPLPQGASFQVLGQSHTEAASFQTIDQGHTHHYGTGAARAHAPGLSQSRMVQIEQDILGKNNEYAHSNRRYFTDNGVLTLNLVSSPGSGKTSLLVRTLTDLKDEFTLSVIEGDQETANDADRIRATGVPALQINTGKGCHLDAHMVGHALERLKPQQGSILFIENVGNLVCPAAFDLGEAHKVAILSVTEGEDKPIKYPDMFHASQLLLLNKIDLLPYLNFDVAQCIEYARRVNPGIQVLQVSATTGQGMQEWYQWLRMTRQMRLIGHPTFNTNAQHIEARV
ncbi:MAG: hydrogenase nickel incorporation protein HypB [Thiofilum sp.]|uniref:hydrogenase nickel incorporation protein HypB n=1 Tax=Thiofilum sp. TaxID=2212733 RepID=UPI0025E4118E|nr:hydrogenase nickel incorporation protein HypB [Thiofilum sp.]MBK8455455.1 hydrogenase nickel incorporation protein HypB [Thiofilum sp.]